MPPRRFTLVLVVLALVAGACGGGKDSDTKTTASKRKTTTTTKSAPSTLVGGDADDATVTTSKGATVTTTKPGTTATTTKAASGSGSGTRNAAPAPAPAGTYDYTQSGSTSQGGPVPPNGTLVVSGPGPSQVFSRYFDPSKPPSDIHFDFRDDGPFITKVVVRDSGIVINCSFDTPVPAPPWPATTGRSFSGHATCDRGFQADFSGSITGRSTDKVGGRSVDTVVIDSTMHIIGNGVDLNVKDTQHWAPSLRITTYSHEVVNGTGPFGIVITGDVTSTLTSTTPR
ncbi:MAG TPA: hypothetical protein VMZ22_09310 [Acidimicrobiales bacterium]|nr:hypothetical protein [Acidimicrobiales bacterium]